MKKSMPRIYPAIVCYVALVTVGGLGNYLPQTKFAQPNVAEWSQSPTPMTTVTPTVDSTPASIPNSQPIEFSNTTLSTVDRVLALAEFFSVVVFGVASIGIVVFGFMFNQTRRRAVRAARAATESARQVADLENRLKDRVEQLQQQVDAAKALVGELQNGFVKLTSIQNETRMLQLQMKLTQDTLIHSVEQLNIIKDIRIYAVKLFDNNIRTREIARRKLVEYSKDPYPIARCECIRIFGTIPDYPEIEINTEYIIRRLKRLASERTEPVQAVRLAAVRALSKFPATPNIVET